MAPESSFAALMARLSAGEQDAADQLFRRFAGRLIVLARKRLDPLLRRKLDPEDVLQSVFKSFFVRHAEGQWHLGSWDSLWGLLTVLTVRKCGHRSEHYRAGRRDVRREMAQEPVGGASDPLLEVLAREPTPDQAAQMAETLQELLSRLDERDRQIAVLSLQGHDSAEVAAQAGCTRRTVQRVLERLRDRLERQQQDETGEREASTP